MSNQLNEASVRRVVKVFTDHGFTSVSDPTRLVRVVALESRSLDRVVYLNRTTGAKPDGSIEYLQIHFDPKDAVGSIRQTKGIEYMGDRKHAGMGAFPMSNTPPQKLSQAVRVTDLPALSDLLRAYKQLVRREKDQEQEPFQEPSWAEADLIESVPPVSEIAGPQGSSTGEVDYEALARRNKQLGDAGEWAALNREIKRLTDRGRADLAERVIHVSRTEGDGAGYDIRSYQADGTERLVEVKTTSMAGDGPYFISANELDVCMRNPSSYVVVRLYGFDLKSGCGKVYEITGQELLDSEMKPLNYQVKQPGARK